VLGFAGAAGALVDVSEDVLVDVVAGLAALSVELDELLSPPLLPPPLLL
jgi:hypothetical protein